MGSSQTRDETCVSYIGRQILYNWITREAPLIVFFILAILIGVKSCLIVVVICVSLITNDIEHLNHVLIGHLYSFFGELFVQILCPFCLGYLSFYFWDIGVFIYSVSEKPINPPWFPGKQGLFSKLKLNIWAKMKKRKKIYVASCFPEMISWKLYQYSSIQKK